MAQAGAYYNEIDPYAADWLRNLIAAGHIAPGDVDERSIEDVHPDDLRPYTQCHFFAGIGVWSYALRRAGWPDDRPVWTGSCPCQPFSAAGKGTAFDDERHLWPAWHWLISECRPPVVFGEQVASKDAEPWLDLVQTDMEALAFAIAAVAFPSASVGAPHIRDRTYFVAHAGGTRLEGSAPRTVGRQRAAAERSGRAGRLADTHGGKCEQQPSFGGRTGVLGTTHDATWQFDRPSDSGPSDSVRTGPVNGFWRAADWLLCRDGKWRPVEPGTFPLVDGSAGGVGRVRADQERFAAHTPRKDQGSRAGRLRAYGNAINAQQAQIFIEEYMRCI